MPDTFFLLVLFPCVGLLYKKDKKCSVFFFVIDGPKPELMSHSSAAGLCAFLVSRLTNKFVVFFGGIVLRGHLLGFI